MDMMMEKENCTELLTKTLDIAELSLIFARQSPWEARSEDASEKKLPVPFRSKNWRIDYI
jgi:hypothetical protein